MSFLEHFTTEQRQLFESAASKREIPQDQYLMRRGEPGGDMFLLRKGSFQVVDTRSNPEVILAVLDEGTVVGEMSFLDDSPRSADVRAATNAEVLRWARADLRALLQRQPALAAIFWESLARLASERARNLTTSAVTGSLTRAEPRAAGIVRLRDEARRIAEITKEGLLEAETALRQDPNDERPQREIRALLDNLETEIRTLFEAHPEAESRHDAARILGRELHPYLVRAALAERCIRRHEGVGGAPDILAHILVDHEGGDGRLGEIVDRWLLDRPTCHALRAWRDATVRVAQESLPLHRNRRITILNVGTGSLVASLAHVVDHPPTVVTVVDPSRDSLAFLDASLTLWPESVELQTIQESLAGLALGRDHLSLPPQDLVVISGVVEYLPERVAVALLTEVKQWMTPGGRVLLATLGPSDDQDALDALLGWPTLRRAPETLLRLLAAAGFDSPSEHNISEPALLLSAGA